MHDGIHWLWYFQKALYGKLYILYFLFCSILIQMMGVTHYWRPLQAPWWTRRSWRHLTWLLHGCIIRGCARKGKAWLIPVSLIASCRSSKPKDYGASTKDGGRSFSDLVLKLFLACFSGIDYVICINDHFSDESSDESSHPIIRRVSALNCKQVFIQKSTVIIINPGWFCVLLSLTSIRDVVSHIPFQ